MPGVLAIGDYGLCITLAAGASPNSSLHFVPCAAISSASARNPPPRGESVRERAPHRLHLRAARVPMQGFQTRWRAGLLAQLRGGHAVAPVVRGGARWRAALEFIETR